MALSPTSAWSGRSGLVAEAATGPRPETGAIASRSAKLNSAPKDVSAPVSGYPPSVIIDPPRLPARFAFDLTEKYPTPPLTEMVMGHTKLHAAFDTGAIILTDIAGKSHRYTVAAMEERTTKWDFERKRWEPHYKIVALHESIAVKPENTEFLPSPEVTEARLRLGNTPSRIMINLPRQNLGFLGWFRAPGVEIDLERSGHTLMFTTVGARRVLW